MAIPTTKKQFADYCIRKLGGDIIDINVSADQIDDRIDEALNKFQQFHYDGSEKIFFKYQVSETDITNKYLTIPDNVIGINGVLDIGAFQSSSALFNVNYQFALNDIFNIQRTAITPYYLAMRHIDLLNYFFSTNPTIRYNFHSNKLYLDDWTNVHIDSWIIVYGYQKLDPNTNPRIWSDIWLQNYATALIKEQWGSVMKKFKYKLPNGVEFSGIETYQEAIEEKKALEEELFTTWSIPVGPIYG